MLPTTLFCVTFVSDPLPMGYTMSVFVRTFCAETLAIKHHECMRPNACVQHLCLEEWRPIPITTFPLLLQYRCVSGLGHVYVYRTLNGPFDFKRHVGPTIQFSGKRVHLRDRVHARRRSEKFPAHLWLWCGDYSLRKCESISRSTVQRPSRMLGIKVLLGENERSVTPYTSAANPAFDLVFSVKVGTFWRRSE